MKLTDRQSAGRMEEFSQEDIICSILQKQDTLAVLPTGGGKSYCFQGPSLCFEGTTLVITAFSATVTQQDRQQISTLLKLKKDAPHFLCYDKRSNLSLSLIHCADEKKEKNSTKSSNLKPRMYELIKILNDERFKGKPCILYCTSIKSLEHLYDTLTSEKYAKYRFHPAKYHGQMSDSQKKKNLERFMSQKDSETDGQSKTNIMIATKAFGVDCQVKLTHFFI